MWRDGSAWRWQRMLQFTYKNLSVYIICECATLCQPALKSENGSIKIYAIWQAFALSNATSPANMSEHSFYLFVLFFFLFLHNLKQWKYIFIYGNAFDEMLKSTSHRKPYQLVTTSELACVWSAPVYVDLANNLGR